MSYMENISGVNQPIADNRAYSPSPDALHLREFIATDLARRSILVLLASAIFTIVIISFRPFSATASIEIAPGGDVVNQIGFLSLLALSGFMVLTQVSTRMVRTVASPVWIATFLAIALAIVVSNDSAGAIRAIALALIAAFVALSIIIVPASLRDFRIVLMLTSIIVLAISYFGILLFPNDALHTAGGSEAQHAGLWRGPFQHKNIAGPIFSIFAIIGVYLFRSGDKAIGIVIALLSFVFVLKTGSKTTAGFLPMAIFTILVASMFRSPRIAIWSLIIALFSAGLLSVGAVYSEFLRSITGTVLADTTFTGRDDLWHFGIDNIIARPIFGFGFDSFWKTDTVENAIVPAYAKWDFRGIVHGHNSYIDTLLGFGFVGGPIILYAVYILPMINYVRAYKNQSQRLLADMFMMIIAFSMLLSLMETFILGRSDPIWILHMFAVFGLQILVGMQKSGSQWLGNDR